jgi:hypothetical protein
MYPAGIHGVHIACVTDTTARLTLLNSAGW